MAGQMSADCSGCRCRLPLFSQGQLLAAAARPVLCVRLDMFNSLREPRAGFGWPPPWLGDAPDEAASTAGGLAGMSYLSLP